MNQLFETIQIILLFIDDQNKLYIKETKIVPKKSITSSELLQFGTHCVPN